MSSSGAFSGENLSRMVATAARIGCYGILDHCMNAGPAGNEHAAIGMQVHN